jgi:hypothetical protein
MDRIPILAFASDGFASRLLLFGATVTENAVTATAFHVRTPIDSNTTLTSCIRDTTGQFPAYILDTNGFNIVTNDALEMGNVVFESIEFRRKS